MKFILVAVFAVLSVVAVNAATISTISVDIGGLRNSLKCGDGVFGELAKDHKELEKYHAQYKAIVNESNSLLDECEKLSDAAALDECVDNVVLTSSMVKVIELIANLEFDNEVLGRKLQSAIEQKCQDF